MLLGSVVRGLSQLQKPVFELYVRLSLKRYGVGLLGAFLTHKSLYIFKLHIGLSVDTIGQCSEGLFTPTKACVLE